MVPSSKGSLSVCGAHVIMKYVLLLGSKIELFIYKAYYQTVLLYVCAEASTVFVHELVLE